MGLWSWVTRLFGKKEEAPPPTSLVFLLREPRYLDAAIVRKAVERAFGVDLSDTSEDARDFVVGGEELPTYIVQVQDRHFLVHNFPTPYFDDREQVARQIGDMRLSKAVRDHQAWLSVDAMLPESEEDAYQRIGKLLAELADEDCLAILAPEFSRINSWEPGLEATLRGPRPLDAARQMSQPPVIEIPADDPAMLAAVAEARWRWPEFVAAFEHRQPGQTFAVKARFQEGEAEEFIWVIVNALEQDTIYGTLDNDPVGLRKLAVGSRVRVAAAEINDWLYHKDREDLHGGFTIEVLRKASAKRQQG
jgi:uncharacterized protein YegJ (DUF2314 family)